jgi:hypothetical protein
MKDTCVYRDTSFVRIPQPAWKQPGPQFFGSDGTGTRTIGTRRIEAALSIILKFVILCRSGHV